MVPLVQLPSNSGIGSNENIFCIFLIITAKLVVSNIVFGDLFLSFSYSVTYYKPPFLYILLSLTYFVTSSKYNKKEKQ